MLGSLGVPPFPHATKSARSEMRTVQFEKVPALKLSAVIDEAIHKAAIKITEGIITAGDEIITITNGVPQLDGYANRSVGVSIIDRQLKIVFPDKRLFKVEIGTNQSGAWILSVKEDTAANGAISTQTLRPKISLNAWCIIGAFILTALVAFRFHYFPSKHYSSPSSEIAKALNLGAETERPPAKPGIYSWSSGKSGTNYSSARLLTLAEVDEKIRNSQTRPERNGWILLRQVLDGLLRGYPVEVGKILSPEQVEAEILKSLSPEELKDWPPYSFANAKVPLTRTLIYFLDLIVTETFPEGTTDWGNVPPLKDLSRTNASRKVVWVVDPPGSGMSELATLGPYASALFINAKNFLYDNKNFAGLPPESLNRLNQLGLNWAAGLLSTFGPSARDDGFVHVTPLPSPTLTFEQRYAPGNPQVPAAYIEAHSLRTYLLGNGFVFPQPPPPSPHKR